MKETKDTFLKFPTYTEIFNNGQEEVIAKLSKEGLAEKFIVFTTSISSMLYTCKFKMSSVQEIIMNKFRDALLDTGDGHLILRWLFSNNLRTLNINEYTLMELYCILLKNKKGQHTNDNVFLSVSEQLLYLKLVLIANERRMLSSEYIFQNITSITSGDIFEYEKMFWPILLPETDVNEMPRIEYEMSRIKCFVEGIIKKHPEAEKKIDDFFQERGLDSYSSYASTLAIIFMDFVTSYTNNGVLKPGIKESEQINKLFTPLAINDAIIKNYLDLKSHPVYYFKGTYYVINWNYLINQIFIGVFMSLKERLKGCNIQGIKNDCGTIIEHTLFKDVLVTSFSKSWQRFAFDDEGKGIPDAMFRIGNNLFILELKDNLMSEKIIESSDYTCIENYINNIFIQSEKGKKKGIKQLDAYIKTYVNNGYEALGFTYNKKLNIYPVIVYTDYKYRLNGLNHYLSIRFNEISTPTEDSVKRRIRPLTVIGLDSLFNLQFKFQKKEINLANIITQYHRYVKNKERKDAGRGIDRFSQLYPSFDRYLPVNRNIFISNTEANIFFRDFFMK